MATEERLRDELDRAAGSVHPDTPAALARVVSVARRRQRVRRVALVVAAVALAVVGTIGITRIDLVSLGRSPTPSDQPSDPQGLSQPRDLHANARTALTGEWQSESLPASMVRGALRRSGTSPALVDRTVGEARRWFVQMTFDQGEGFAALVVRTSDPTNPGASLRTSDHFLYRLLPGHRLVVTPTHPGTRWLFSYRLEGGDALHLRPLRSGSGPVDDRTAAQLVAWTFAPLTLVH